MLINRGTADNGIFMWDESVDKFTLGLTTADGSATGNITLNSLGTLVANIEGAVTGTVSSLSNHDTDDLAEGSSLYYTDARSRSAISATGDISYNSSTGVISFTQSASPVTSVNTQTGAVVLDTDDVGEGSTNIYFTNARADTRINLQTGANLDLSSKSTSDLSEGSNLYYTDARSRASISEDSAQLSYNSTTGVLSYTQGDTDTVSEGTTNLYYTDARANSAIDARVTKSFVDALNVVAASATGNAGTATALATSRDFSIAGDITASGVSFDGTGNVALSASIDANTVGISEINVSDGTSGQVLTTDGAGNLSFSSVSGTTINNNADNRVITGSGTANTLNGEANFVFDGTNVGIGTSSPDTQLNIKNADDAVVRIESIGSESGDDARLEIKTTNGTFTIQNDRSLGTSGALTFAGNTSNNLVIDHNSGNVGIGTANPQVLNHISSGYLAPTGGIDSNIFSLISNSASAGSYAGLGLLAGNAAASFIHFGDTDDMNSGTLDYFHSDNSMRFSTNGGERVRIDNTGAVGIGQVPETARFSGHDILQVGGRATFLGNDTVSSTGQTALLDNLYYDASGNFQHRGDARGVAMQFVEGQVIFSNSNQTTGTPTVTPRMTLDSSGRLLVGTTSTTPAFGTGTGIAFVPTGESMMSANSATTLFLNRTTSDGTILDFRKDGSTVGSIGVVSSNNLKIHSTSSGHSGLSFGTGIVYATDNSGDATNNGTDLGSSSYTWKDIYLGGGAYIGGTGSANKLDDYEEGTFTPTLDNAGSPVFAYRSGWYTKIGDIVHFNLFIDVTSGISGTSQVQIGGLPFNISSKGNLNYVMFNLFIERGVNGGSATQGYAALGQAGNAAMEIWEQFSTTGYNYNGLNYGEVNSSSFRVRISGTYHA
jgi:hypothetical protein